MKTSEIIRIGIALATVVLGMATYSLLVALQAAAI
jgi:hypothetical protein